MRKIFFLFIVLNYFGCNRSATKNKISKDTAIRVEGKDKIASKYPSSATNNNLTGAWTDGTTQNATFDIGTDSIYYVDHLKSYKYSLSKDSIKIFYEDYTFSAKVSFIKDTLVMDSEDGISKFWHFKD